MWLALLWGMVQAGVRARSCVWVDVRLRDMCEDECHLEGCFTCACVRVRVWVDGWMCVCATCLSVTAVEGLIHVCMCACAGMWADVRQCDVRERECHC